tara:strand:+ start:192 stop:542 length:351 start_codon:yes stop_codon:yes gene_type:complete
MIDELEILKTIIGDITGIGIWGVVAWIMYKLAVAGMWLGAFIYTIKAVKSFVTSPVTKVQADVLNSANMQLKRDIEETKHKCKMETENLKHMYKILKESSNNESSESASSTKSATK